MHKGIILAGGAGTRLRPITSVISKQLTPIYDKPLIYYPLSTLLLAGCEEILIISSPDQIGAYERLLGSGAQFGVSISYEIQERPGGLPEAFIIGEKFLNDSPAVLALGDNVFYGSNLTKTLKEARSNDEVATIFGYVVKNPSDYGVAEVDDQNRVLSLEEKPVNPKSSLAVTGLYFFPSDVCTVSKRLEVSKRGELEIVDLINYYIRSGSARLERLSRGYAWFDTGTFDGMLDACNFVAAVQKRQGLLVSSPEETAFNMGLISVAQLRGLASSYNNSYGDLLERSADQI